MLFHEFGDKDNPVVILIHGMLTPWQMWDRQIEYYSDRFFVIVPALNAHVEEEVSLYISAENESDMITEYMINNYGKEVFLLAGLSMGGVVANKIFESGKLNIRNLVLDGAPLVPASRIIENIMIKNYVSIIHKSQKRDHRVLENFVKYFMPERFLHSFLKIADTMSDESVGNIVRSACRCEIHKKADTDTKILFLHGTKTNEMLAKKAIKTLRKAYPNVIIRSFNGYAHGEMAIFHPDEWCKIVDNDIQIINQ